MIQTAQVFTLTDNASSNGGGGGITEQLNNKYKVGITALLDDE